MPKERYPLDPALGIRPNLLQWLPVKPEMAFATRNRRAAVAWQARARARFLECLGRMPPRTALQPRVLERIHKRGYARTMLTLETAPHLKALCWLCEPDERRARGGLNPAMIATPGHGIGARDLLAMDGIGHTRQEGRGYQKDYALQAVRLGYTVLVVEPLGFGERRDMEHFRAKASETGCHAATNLAMMLGTTLAALRINDLRRALDYFQDVPGVDPARVGLMGISGGGQMTLWTSALETRFKVAVVSGYLNTLRDSIMGMYHCACNFVPGLAAQMDMSDLATMIAPRPLLVESATRDSIFPIQASREAVKTVRKNYAVFGAQDRVVHDVFSGEHQWSGRKLETFLADGL